MRNEISHNKRTHPKMSDSPAQADVSGQNNNDQDVTPTPPLSEVSMEEECYCYVCHDRYRCSHMAHARFCRTGEDYHQLIATAMDDGNMVKVSVGEGDSSQIFNVHEKLLCSTSEFFKKALNGHWKESKERIVPLPEEDPTAFKVYFEWLMLNKLLIGPRHEHPEAASRSAPADFAHTILQCYVLGDHIMDPKFKNYIIEEIHGLITQYGWLVPKEWLRILPTKLPESSGLFRLYIDVWAFQAEGDWLDHGLTIDVDDSTSLLISVAKQALDCRPMPDMSYWQQDHLKCYYFDGFPESISCKELEQQENEEFGSEDFPANSDPEPFAGDW